MKEEQISLSKWQVLLTLFYENLKNVKAAQFGFCIAGVLIEIGHHASRFFWLVLGKTIYL